jgi:GDP-L-fucose synthase
MCLLTEKYASADPVNLGHNRETTIRDLLGLILKVTGQRRQVIFDISKPEGAVRKSCDPTKLETITGFVPAITLEQSLSETIDFYRQTL